jgi:hypothetical protein
MFYKKIISIISSMVLIFFEHPNSWNGDEYE